MPENTKTAPSCLGAPRPPSWTRSAPRCARRRGPSRWSPPRAPALLLRLRPTALVHRGDLDAIIRRGPLAARSRPARRPRHLRDEAWRRNLNDPRVLSNYGLTPGCWSRAIGSGASSPSARRRCAAGCRPTETLVNLARALVVTRTTGAGGAGAPQGDGAVSGRPARQRRVRRARPQAAAADPWLPRQSTLFLNKWIGRLTWKYSRRARPRPAGRPE